MSKAIIMQLITFKRPFSVIFNAVKTQNVEYLDEKAQPIKKILIDLPHHHHHQKNRLKFHF